MADSRVRAVAWGLALAAALLSGCQHNPPLAPADAVLAAPALAPSRNATLQADLDIERWWHLFDDAALEHSIERALERNRDLAVAAARLREAHGRFVEIDAQRRPTADLQLDNTRARTSADTSMPPGNARTGSRHSATLVGRYELDLWGRLGAAGSAARDRLVAQSWARASIQWSLSAQVAQTHFDLRALARQIEIGESVRASRARTLALRQREHQAGLASEFEVRRAEAELAAADISLFDMQRRRMSLEGAMALLSGDEPEAIAATEPASRQPLDPSTAPIARLPAGEAGNWLQHRPDVRQAEAQLAAARADVAGARAATLPVVRLTGSLGSDVRSLSSLFSGPGFAWSLAAGMAQSLFDSGASQARVDQADARAESAQVQYRQVVAQAVVELRDAYASIDWREQAFSAERQRVAALDRARQLAERGYAAGVLAQIDVLDAERNGYSAQLSEVGAYRDRLVAQVAAYKALGGGHDTAPSTTRSGDRP